MTILRLLSGAPTAAATITLFALMVMTFADVVLRSVANAPIPAAPELTRIMVAVIVFSALPMMSFRGGHIAVDLADPLWPKAARRWRDAVIAGVCGAMLIWPAMRCVTLAERARDYGDVTEFLRLPTFYITWFIAIAVFATAAALILRAALLIAAPHLVETPE